jgi:hypothetical protein
MMNISIGYPSVGSGFGRRPRVCNVVAETSGRNDSILAMETRSRLELNNRSLRTLSFPRLSLLVCFDETPLLCSQLSVP